MADDPVFQYLKLFLDYAPAWVFLVVGILIWLSQKPQIFSEIAKYVSSAKIGEFEIELREVKAQLAETETQLVELEEENLRLNQLYADFDAHAPTQNLAPTRQELRTLAGNLTDLKPVLSALEPGSSHQEIYAAAEILRQRRDFSAFDTLVSAVDRIASSENLEDIRYHTVWTLASAVHRTVLAAVKHSEKPQLSKEQLENAQRAMRKLHDNPHVQHDRPDAPKQGIRGPASYALDWIAKGLAKFEGSPD